MHARIVQITDTSGKIVEAGWLKKARPVHLQLRPKLSDNYVEQMQRVFSQGAGMCIAELDGAVLGAAVYRMYENTVDGMQMYVDDLITDENRRSLGVGKTLLDYLQNVARESGCKTFTLDSGTWRQQAHKFYFREGMVINSFHFFKSLD